jgi:hypothetical protein
MLLSATAVFAKTDRIEPVAHMSPSAAGISWSPIVDHEKLTLIISAPDGTRYSKDFNSGNAPLFRLQDLPGKAGDGQYLYEIRVTPRTSSEVKRQLAAARAADDDASVQRIQHANGLDRVISQSGTLTVINGSFVNSDVDEPASSLLRIPPQAATSSTSSADKDASAMYRARVTPMTLVTAQDEVIQGSLCVGLDCTATESFGFDTIRVKENNTRIKFDDTSTSAGFPNNDWQLTANDSASGGANKFSIDDVTGSKTPFTVTAGAPTNSLFVASSGKIGVGNGAPGLTLHLTATDTPAIRQEQTSGGGFTAQTWDIGANEANWFVRDVTGGSRLPLRIRPGAPTSSVDIAASGRVGIGTASPGTNLHVFAASASDGFIGVGEDPAGTTGTQSAMTIGYGGNSLGRGVGFLNVRPDSNAAAPNPSLRFLTQNVLRMIIDRDGNVGFGNITSVTNPIQHANGAFLSSGGVWTNSSSRELKQDIADLTENEAKSTLENLKPVKYAYKIDPNEHHVGFIAEDVPSLVATKDRKGLSSMDIVAVLTKVVQQQQSTIDELKSRLDQLEKKQ